jgi:tetratricopeptide (TPR) repeat protein
VETRCPTCGARPPATVACDACEESFAPFITAGACPRCAVVWDRLACAECDAWPRLEAWVVERSERARFLERLVANGTRIALNLEHRLKSDVRDYFTGNAGRPTIDKHKARVAVLVAEDALEGAKVRERAVCEARGADTTEASASRETARKLTEEALRRLVELRAAAERANRLTLDAKRSDPEPAIEPEPVVIGPLSPCACPSCGWRADGRSRWGCTRCGTSFDALATRARCPKCARRFEATVCPRCKAWSPFARWGGPDATNDAEPAVSAVATAEAAHTPLARLAGGVVGSLDRSDRAQDALATGVERVAEVADRALDQLTGLWAKGKTALQKDDDGKARLKESDWRGVVEQCTATLARQPDRILSHLHRGVARVHLGDDAGALADLDAALQSSALSPAERALALTERGALRSSLCDFDRAIADAREALLLSPAATRPRATIFLALWRRGDLRTLVEDASVVTSAAQRAEVRLALDDWSAAGVEATKALLAGEHGAMTYLTRAIARQRLGRLVEARADVARALRLAPEFSPGYALRACLRAAGGDLGAIDDLARAERHDERRDIALERWPMLPVWRAHLGGEKDLALRRLRRLRDLAIDPRLPSLWIAWLIGADDPLPEAGDGWSGALVRFARDELDADGLVSIAATGDGVAPRLCEAHGYLALRADHDGRTDDAARHHRACVEQGQPFAVEHLWSALRLAGATPRARTPIPAAPPAPPTPPRSTNKLLDDLERLGALREQGFLSADEFAAAKKRLLDG